jgi:thioredoxin-related protein
LLVAAIFLAIPAIGSAQEAKSAVQKSSRPSIYDAKADAKEQIKAATALARRDAKRVLVMFGGDWCGWCHKLHGLFASDPAIREVLREEYVLVMVDTEAPGALVLLDKCKAALSEEDRAKVFGVPFLSVLDSDGKVVKAQRTDPLEEGDHHDPAKVKDFLNAQMVTPKDAEVVLREGLERASSDDKRVFLTFSAPWCGWCHKLADWMAKPEIGSILDRDLVIVKVDIDRMTNGKDVMAKVRPNVAGGIPWFVVLDSKGKSLGNSDGPQGNIGYPFKPEEIDHFMTVISGQSRHIEAGQLERLKQSLKDSALEIEKQQKARQAARPATAPAPAAAPR